MIAVRRTNPDFGAPFWAIPSSISARRSGPSWVGAKEVYVRRAGPTWTKVWHENNWGAVGSQHPHWQYALNFDFIKTDDTLSWGTFWSTGNAGFYTYPSSGRLRLEVGQLDSGGAGDVYLEPAVTLKVAPGQTYTHSVFVDSRTTGTNMSLRAYSNTTKAEAYKAGAGRTAFETPLQVVAEGTTVSLSITIPTGHEWIKLYLFVQAPSGPLPKRYTFQQWRFLRTA